MKRKSRLLTFVLLMAIVFTTVFSVGSISSAASLPGFYVQGRYLYDYLGNKTTLIGPNAMLIYWDGVGANSYPNIAQTGANCVRIFWRADPVISAAQFDTAMQNAINNNLIPIPGLWNATGDWSQLDTCVNWWLSPEILPIVKKYEKYMILNIANEAGDASVSKSAWEAKYKEVITRFRNAGVHCPLMIDAANWGRDESYILERGPALVAHDPDHNLIFGWHPWDENQPRSRYHNAITTAIANNICLVVSEFASVGVFYDKPIDWQGIVEECIEHDTGWMPWVWRGASSTDGHNITNDYVHLTTWGNSIVPYITANSVPSPIFGGGQDPDPDILEIDNFEGYSSDSALQSAYPRVDHGNTVTVYRDTANKNGGSYGMRYAYTIGTPNYAGVRRSLNNANWSGYDGIQFWLKPDGSGRTLTIQFRESSNEYWETTYVLSGTTARVVQLPFSSFDNPPWGGTVDGILNLSSINEISIWVNQGSGSTGSSTIYFDSIAAYKGGAPGVSYSEDFNDNQAQGWTIPSGYSVSNGVLSGGNWTATLLDIYDGRTWTGDYTYRIDMNAGGGGTDYNSARVVFNYTNSNNYYFVSFGGSQGAVALQKVVNGTTSTIASYGLYPVAGRPTTVEIVYDDAGYITVRATQSGSTTTLFNNVRDTSLTSGKIGAGTQHSFATFDNVTVTQ